MLGELQVHEVRVGLWDACRTRPRVNMSHDIVLYALRIETTKAIGVDILQYGTLPRVTEP